MTKSSGGWGSSYAPRCYTTHKPLDIGGFQIYGGSCSSPVVKDADIYVGFDGSMVRTHRQYPWDPGTEFLYKIVDMAAPSDSESFVLLLDYLAVQLTAGKKIHLGCIGGHGRTGTVLAALVKVITGEADAISYVRKNYCEKAVESTEQVRFLSKHFGITEVPGYKSSARSSRGDLFAQDDDYLGGALGSSWSRDKFADHYPYPKIKKAPKGRTEPSLGIERGKSKSSASKATFNVQPSRNDKVSIWGDSVVFDKSPEPDIITI